MPPPQREPLHWRHRPFSELVRLAWPISVSMLSFSVMTLVDTLLVARLGPSALAGVSVGGVAAFTLLCFGWGLLRSVKVLVSQASGAGHHRRVGAIVAAGLILALAFGLANILLGRLAATQLHRVMATAESAGWAGAYLDVRVLGAPLFLGAATLREARHGVGETRLPMQAAVAANLVNVLGDWLFIFELELGVAGAAWASVLAHGVDLAILLAAARRAGDLPRRSSASRPAWGGGGHRVLAQVGAVWRIGLPLGGQMLLEVAAFAILTAMFAAMGEVDVAAHQIALQVIHFSFLPALAIGEAASVMVGQAVGADRDDLVQPLARHTLRLTGVFTGACAVVFAAAAHPIAGAFSDDVHLQEVTVRLLYVAAAFQLFDGANVVGRSVLRGTGDVRWPAAINVAMAWLVTPPVTLLLGYGLGWGVLGGWCGFCAEIVGGACLLWWRLERGRWRSAAVRSRRELQQELEPSSGRPLAATTP